MKYLLLISAIIISTSSWSQKLPRKSAKAKMEQLVGLTEVEIEYSRPNVNNRVVFGELVPYGKVWRFGADKPTIIEIDRPISINSTQLDTGRYAIFAIPELEKWKIVFNSDTEQWGAYNYDESKNVLELDVNSQKAEHTESFTLSFANVNQFGATLVMNWAKVQIEIPFTTDTRKAVEESISAEVEKGEDLSKVYYYAADYFYDNGDVNMAKSYLDKSIAIERKYNNLFLQASIMKDEDLKGGIKLAEEAAKLAADADKKRWVDHINESIEEWKGQ